MSTSYDTLDETSTDEPQVDEAEQNPFIPAITVEGTTPVSFQQPASREVGPFQPSTEVGPFQPSLKSAPIVGPFQPSVGVRAEEPKSDALRLAEETAQSYKAPPQSQLARQVAGETARGFQDQAVKEDTATLQNLDEAKQGNLPGLIKYLEKNQVVAPDVQKAYLDDLKANATKEAQKHWNIADPTAAYSKLMSDVSPLDWVSEIGSKIIPNVQSALTSWNQSQETVDENRFMKFVKAISPNVTPDRLIAFKNNLASMRPEDRSAYMYNMLREAGQIDPTTGAAPAVGDMVPVIDSVNRLLDPKWQKDQAEGIKAQVDQNTKNLEEDPRLKGTFGGLAAENLAAVPKYALEAVIPGFGQSLMASEIYQSTLARVRAEHPELSESDQKAKASASTLYQLGGAELLNLTTGGFLGGATGNIKNVFSRVIASTAVHAPIGGAAGAVQQITANLSEGRPIFKDVPDSIIGGLIQGAPGGIIGALTHRPAPEVKVPLRPGEVKPEVTEPPLGENVPRGTIPEPEVGEKGAPKTGPEAKTLETGGEPVTPFGETTPPAADEATITEPEMLPQEPRREPTVTEPEVDQTEQNHQELVKAADEIYDRNKTEIALGGLGEEKPAEVAPVGPERPEPFQPVSDLGIVQPAGETGVAPVPEPVRPDRGGVSEGVVTGREPVPSQRVVQPELGELPGLLERKLSKAEVKEFQPEVTALKTAPRDPTDPQFVQAYRDLREKVISRFQDILDSAGITRLPDDVGDHFGAHIDSDTGKLSLATNLAKGSEGIAKALNQGVDPLALLHSSVQEEILHGAQQKVQYDDWVAGGRQGTYVDHVKNWAKQGYSDLFQSRDNALANGKQKLASEIDTAIQRSWPTYKFAPGGNDEAALHAAIDSGNLRDVALRAYELVRQMMQVKSGNPLTEEHFRSVWKRARDWLVKVRDSLGALAKRLGPGKELAKTEIGRIFRAVDAEIKAMDARAREWRKAGAEKPSEEVVPQAPSREAIVPEAPTPKSAKEKWEDFLTYYSTRFKGGESTMLDFPELHPIARAERREPSYRQRVGELRKDAQLERVWNSIRGKDRERVLKEYDAFNTAEQNKQPLPAVSPDTQRLIDAGKDSMEANGKLIEQLKVQIKDGSVYRLIKRIGRSFFPRIMSADTEDIFKHRDGSRQREFDQLANDAIARGIVKNRDEYVELFGHAINGKTPEISDDYHARKLDLPLKHYDMSPEALFKYLEQQKNKLARIAAYGQKIGEHGKTIFDTGAEKIINSKRYTPDQKQMILDRLEWERRRVYQRDRVEPIQSALSTVSTGAFLGSPVSALRNFITGVGSNYIHGGPLVFAKNVAKFPFRWRQEFRNARDANILKNSMRDIVNDLETVSNPGWLTKSSRKFANVMLGPLSGQNLTENINRVFGAMTAKEILRNFLKTHGVRDSAAIRDRNAGILRRFGIKDPRSAEGRQLLDNLAAEKGSGKLTDEFIRQWVLDIHGSYEQAQAPAHWFDNNAGKVIFQFQKFGANQTRLATREFIMPLADAVKRGNPADIGYQFIRNVHFLAVAGVGMGALTQVATGLLLRRDPTDPSFEEIGKAIMQGHNAEAVQWMLQRSWGAFILSGISGLVGNYADMANSYIGSNRGRLKDPTHPPAFGLIEPLMAFGMGWAGESGGKLKAPSPKLFNDLADKFAWWRDMSRMGYAGMSRLQPLNNQWAREYAAKQDNMFLRNRVAMFAQTNPTLQAKQSAQGTRYSTIQMAGRKVTDPYQDRVINGLMTGNSDQVADAIRGWVAELKGRDPKADVKAILQQIHSVIDSNSPLKIGGSTNQDIVNQFLAWTKANLPEGEGRRIFALAYTYRKASMDSGLEPLNLLALKNLDYDKFKAPKALPEYVQKMQERIKQREGEISLKEMIMRQKLAERLLQHH